MMQPQFNQASVEKQLIQWAAENERKFIMALQYLGDEFVNRARSINTYLDQTGNLRSSIGYVIAKNGKILRSNYEQVLGGSKGTTEGMALAEEAAAEHPNGIVLIVTAGMQYALYVEAMGYDVLSGSVPNRSQVLDSFMVMMQKAA